MKPSEFYDNYGSQNIVGGGNTVTERWTKGVNALDTEFGEVSQEAYWLGWIRPENVPTVLKHTKYMYDTESDTLSFEIDNVVSNYPCGYVRADYQYNLSGIYINGEHAKPFNNRFYNTYFLNDLHPEYSAATGDAVILLILIQKDNGEVVPKGVIDGYPSVQLRFGVNASNGTLGDLLEFLNGENTITITYGQYSYDINVENFAEGYAEITSNESETRTALIVFSGYINPGIFPCNSNNEFATDFALKMSYIDSEDTEIFYNVRVGNRNTVFTPYAYYIDSASVVDMAVNNAGGGLEGEFKISELNALNVRDGYLIDGNIFGFKVYGSGGSNPRIPFYHIYTPDEIYKLLALNYRVDVSGTLRPNFSYIKDVTYATDVSSTNEFLARLKTGNISNDEFRDGLRYWQYSSITNNDFDEDDVPPYEPPAPPAEGEESGDLIDNQYRYFGASKFITQYALTRSQLELFGEKLWTSWADTLGDPTEMWKNFKMFIGGGSDTGSIDISTAMDFIISLRVFPYNLTDSLMQDVNGIRLGRGEYPIDVGVVKKMISLIQYVDFGTITVPRPFGDYRDYENMNVSLVLPYCGTTMLNPGDVIGRNLTCTYAVDLQAGTCEAFVYVTNTSDTGQCRYNVAQMSGQIGALLPVSATNSGQIMSQRISDAASVAATIASPIDSLPSSLMGAASGNMSGAALHKAANIAPILGIFNPELYSGITDVANALSRPAISCPSLGGGSGLSAFHQPAAPYIQLRYGMYTKPNNYNHSVGVPSTSNGVLSSYSGFVVCGNVDVSSLTCHTDEKAAIKAALESGVYV